MSELKDSIFKLRPVYKSIIWGGTKIRDLLHKDVEGFRTIAESWEVSTHSMGRSVIDGGEFDGKTLNEYFDTIGWDKIGAYGTEFHRLPLMVKYIDAYRNLSIQVHPNDEFARINEQDSGKNEIWYVVGASRGAFIYLGFNRDISKEEVVRRIKDNTLEEVLNKIPVKKDEAYFIPAGTVHAIGAGCLICEIQQTSDVTYRIYDYGRTDEDGKCRELHIDKALQVLDFNAYDFGRYSERDLNHVCRYLNEKIRGGFSIVMYEGEGDLTNAFPRECITFVLFYGGKGKISCGKSQQTTGVGDTWLVKGQSVTVTGNCKAIILTL